jgi:hypothetical protein
MWPQQDDHDGFTFIPALGLNDYLRNYLGVPPGGGGLSVPGLMAGGLAGVSATLTTYPDVL